MVFFRLLFNRYTGLVAISCLSMLFLFEGRYYQAKPDLQSLYQESRAVMDQPPVVFIHGVLGGKLRNKQTKDEVWPGSSFNLLFGKHDQLALEIDAETLKSKRGEHEVFAIADSTAGKDFYGNIIKTLTQYGQYREAFIGQRVDPTKKFFYSFYYDWREDNIKTVRRLADFIERIRVDYGNPHLKVDLVAHSMGGLIARYYIRYGRVDVLSDNHFPVNLYGAKRVRRAILLGTPNLGSVKLMNAFINGINVGYSRINPETLATMPSLYQMLPHPLNTWAVTTKGEPLELDLFDIEIWRRFKWNIFNPAVRERLLATYKDPEEGVAYLQTLEKYFHKNIERARRFAWSLTIRLEKEHPKLIVFGGDCTPTPARIIIEEIDGQSYVRTQADQISQPIPDVNYQHMLMEPGDGAVTKASLLGRNVLDPSVPRHKYSFFPLDHAVLLCERHNSLTANISFQDNLLNALLGRD